VLQAWVSISTWATNSAPARQNPSLNPPAPEKRSKTVINKSNTIFGIIPSYFFSQEDKIDS
jgi:hypothetical protein